MTPARLLRGVALAALLASCAHEPAEDLPAGTLWAGDAGAARSLLSRITRLTGTPAAVAATELANRLAGCGSFLAFCPAGRRCSLAAALTCSPHGELAARADRVRGRASWLLVDSSNGRRLAAWGTTRPDGDVDVRAEVGGARARGAPALWEMLLPARQPPAAPVLASDGALIQLRLRSDLGTAPLQGLGSSGWGEQLFSLKGELFLAMTLEGTSELTLYDPSPGEMIPPMALALHVRDRERGVRAIEEFLAHVRERWPVSRAPWRLGRWQGACLTDLNVLPQLAPCYVATDRAMVLGWNRESVERALRVPPRPAGDESELVLLLDRLPAADARLRAAYGSQGGPTPSYPWQRATLSGRGRRWGGYDLRLRLAASARRAVP